MDQPKKDNNKQWSYSIQAHLSNRVYVTSKSRWFRS